VAFEKNALEEKLANFRSKDRGVYLVEGNMKEKILASRQVVKQDKLEAKIANLEAFEAKQGWQ
jgi:hypothetical protein